jgi:hypothetical protein
MDVDPIQVGLASGLPITFSRACLFICIHLSNLLSSITECPSFVLLPLPSISVPDTQILLHILWMEGLSLLKIFIMDWIFANIFWLRETQNPSQIKAESETFRVHSIIHFHFSHPLLFLNFSFTFLFLFLPLCWSNGLQATLLSSCFCVTQILWPRAPANT